MLPSSRSRSWPAVGSRYEVLFGRFPSLQGVPANASPVRSAEERKAWEARPEGQRDAVNRAFSNLGKAIAAFERTVIFGESRFGRYVAAVMNGDAAGQQMLNAQESSGLGLFIGKAERPTAVAAPPLFMLRVPGSPE